MLLMLVPFNEVWCFYQRRLSEVAADVVYSPIAFYLALLVGVQRL